MGRPRYGRNGPDTLLRNGAYSVRSRRASDDADTARRNAWISSVGAAMLCRGRTHDAGGSQIMSTKEHLPGILVRGFGGLGVADERRIAYQGFNDGTVYPGKRGENYIYEGLDLKFLKSFWQYQDATNVVGYYSRPIADSLSSLPSELAGLDPGFFVGDKVVID